MYAGPGHKQQSRRVSPDGLPYVRPMIAGNLRRRYHWFYRNVRVCGGYGGAGSTTTRTRLELDRLLGYLSELAQFPPGFNAKPAFVAP